MNGDESVRDAIAIGFLEHLMDKDPAQIKFSTFVHHMGINAIRFCRAYDKLTDMKTEGLWDPHRADANISSSSTAAAIRYELVTGEQIFGISHSQKGRDMITCLKRWLENNPTASLGDRAAAENMIKDLEEALGE